MLLQRTERVIEPRLSLLSGAVDAKSLQLSQVGRNAMFMWYASSTARLLEARSTL